MLALLEKHEIKILPKDAELVIDLWLEIEFNDGIQDKKHLIDEFRREYGNK